jgi:hypothetical protein
LLTPPRGGPRLTLTDAAKGKGDNKRGKSDAAIDVDPPPDDVPPPEPSGGRPSLKRIK